MGAGERELRRRFPGLNISLSLGETVNCHFHFRKLGKIVVVQESQPDGEPQDFSYTAGGGLSPASFTLDDDTNATLPNTQTFSDLQPGSSYSVMQPSTPAGWNSAQVTCSDGSSPSAIDVSYGETVTCTFANRLVDSGTITVKLDRQPDASEYFPYNTTGFGAAAPSSFYLQDDGNEGYEPSSVTYAVHPGSGYGVAPAPSIYFDSTASCSDGSPISSIDVSQGEDVVCTFVNKQRPSVRIVLDAQLNDPQDFTYDLAGGPTPRTLTLDDDSNPTLPNNGLLYVTPGSYTLTQGAVAGWETLSSSCSNGQPLSNLNISYGDNITCTFTNRNQHPGHLTLRLDAQPDDDAQFAFKVTGNTTYPGIVLQDNGNPSDGFDNFHPSRSRRPELTP